MASPIDDKTYRHLVDQAFAAIDAAFADVDPDDAEVSIEANTLTVLFRGKIKCLVTPQPPVRQVWMAFRDNAWHFDFEPATGRWLDDRGRGLELLSTVARLAQETVGASIAFPLAKPE